MEKKIQYLKAHTPYVIKTLLYVNTLPLGLKLGIYKDTRSRRSSFSMCNMVNMQKKLNTMSKNVN